jgi:hypothetical protein
MEDVDARASVVEYLNAELVGPANGKDEVLREKPHKRYLIGMLFPLEAVEDDIDDDTPDEVDTTVSLSSEFKPSSMALSFAVHQNAVFKLVAGAGSYQNEKKNWCRAELLESIKFDCSSEDSKSISVFNGRGEVTIVKRPWKAGWIVTTALSNAVNSGPILDPGDCLYQSELYIESTEGEFTEYPTSDRFKFDEEQEELALTYRKRINWAVGHGCAAIWDKTNPVPGWIKTASIPATEVLGFSTEIDFSKYPSIPENVLSLQWLSDEGNSPAEIQKALEAFIAAYASWIEAEALVVVPEHLQAAKNRILGRLRNAESRMRKGVLSLLSSNNAMRSFRLANKAMLMQIVHSREEFGGARRFRNENPFQRPDYTSSKYSGIKWRPFQLAFSMLVIESLIYTKEGDYEDSRDVVDLLWFPTGGGKTEAYLALASWEMIYRRLEDGLKGAGTTVIKRYTLRLLTSQQFQRAGTLICALELIRRDHEQQLGATPFSLGLWVGGELTPNKFTSGNTEHPEAFEKFEALLEESKPENPFQLQQCPWCGTCLVPESKSNDSDDYGIDVTATSFSFNCPTDTCEFNSDLPIQVVDEALYKSPPSMLIGTIDKFARLAWKHEGSAFFGSNGKYNPPSLIIQDEMHLISGPLGTIAGIYEAGIDALIKRLGGRPKVIAATATIRAASQQAKRLFGRAVSVFPPSGTDDSDSFYSTEDQNAPGRLYLGAMPSGHTGQTALVQAAAAVLQAPMEGTLSAQQKDVWWTVPIYHNSRRELGKTMTLARDDIPARIEVISPDPRNQRNCDEVEELSANVRGPRIPDLIERLKQPFNSAGCIDVLPCTNMISVGVDIQRLGVMIVNGQPKTTAEYIQASSRVGRDKDRPPAIILTLFSPSKPRDRSHYETFNTYHQALYRHVEPTSVTPWAPPARDRALHAALIVLVRLSDHLMANTAAGQFDKNDSVFSAIYKNLKDRIGAAADDLGQEELDKIFTHMQELVDRWHLAATQNDIQHYENQGSGKGFRPLMKNYGENSKTGLWPTLNSMRNVDTESALIVRGEST